jgi:hypothetical protein
MSDPCTVCSAIRSKPAADRLIASLADRQHGAIARRQLLDEGVSRFAIDRRIARGSLRPVHRGVYAAGHPTLTRDGKWMAATLAAGPGAALSHRAAGTALSLLASSYLEVTAASRRAHSGVRIHRAVLPPDEITTVRRIPVTTLPRTLLDLATVLPKNQLERAFHEAQENILTDSLSLPDLLDRYPGRAGAPAIRHLLEATAPRTRSELEDLFQAFLARYDLPRPEINAWLHTGGRSFECDCLWRDSRLIVELDGRACHDTTLAFEDDRARDRHLAGAGWSVIRVTWRQLREQRHAIAADLSALLYPVDETSIAQTAAKGLSGSATGR